MERIFPELFRKAIARTGRSSRASDGEEGGLWSLANLLSRWVLIPYLTTVGLLRNKRLERIGNITAHFRTIIEPGFFAYESDKYEILRSAYEEAFD
jgi:hypothetical protein